MKNEKTIMKGLTIIILITVFVILISATYYFFDIKVKASTSKQCIGLTYSNGSPRALLILSKVRNVMTTLQGVTCAFVKPAWKNMKPTLMAASGTSETAGTSCSAQKNYILAFMKNQSTASITIPLSEKEKAKLQAAIIALFTEVLDQTCENDKVEVTKAVTLMDEIIQALCL